MDLILHIGLPKTGTTLIQNRLLAKTRGYLGKVLPDDRCTPDRDSIYRLQTIAPWHRHFSAEDREYRLDRQTRHWAHQLFSRHEWQSNHLTISQEHLSKWPRSDSPHAAWPIETTDHPRWLTDRDSQDTRRSRPIPIAEYIANYLRPAWSPFGEVYVLITLRNQATYLASLYAQLSDRIAKAGQRDFENQVSRLIAENDPSIDWHKIVADIAAAVGDRQLLVLFFEEMSTERFWTQLGHFMRIDDIPAQSLADIMRSNDNVRSSDESTWRTRWRPGLHLSNRLRHRISRTTGGESTNYIFSFLEYAERHILDPMVIPLRSRQRDRSIRLGADLRDDVRHHCSASNSALGSYLGRHDLGDLGY